MKIKLLKSHNETPAGSIVEVDEVSGKSLIADSVATEWNDEAAELERTEAIRAKAATILVEAKQVNLKTSAHRKEDSMDYVIGKMFQRLAGKAITGNSETGSAQDGGGLVTTGLAELVPVVMSKSVAYAKCRKIPVQQGANAMKVPVSKSNFHLRGTAPTVTAQAEGVAPSVTKLALDPRTLTLTKGVILCSMTAELLEDAASAEAWVRGEMAGKLANVLDAEVLIGSTLGFTGVNGDSNYCQALTVTGTPTAAELAALVSAISGDLNPEWYLSKTMADLVIGTFLTSANINKMIVDPVGKTIMGLPYHIIPALGAGDMIIGDFSQYAVIESPLGDRFAMSSDVKFSEDEVYFKLVHRGAGAAIRYLQTGGDGLKTGAFAEKS